MHKYINYSNIFSDILPSLRTPHWWWWWCALSHRNGRTAHEAVLHVVRKFATLREIDNFFNVSSRGVMKCASKRRSEFSICEHISAGPSVTTSLHSLFLWMILFLWGVSLHDRKLQCTSGHLHMAKKLSFSDKWVQTNSNSTLLSSDKTKSA